MFKKLILILLFFASQVSFGATYFVLMGPPGSGKGTFSNYMSTTHHYQQICVGDILKDHIRNETDLGRKIKPIVEKGDFVAPEIGFEILQHEVDQCLERQQPFIIDGFIRNGEYFDFVNKLLQARGIDAHVVFLHFETNDETCVERVKNRLVCPACHDTYNLATKPPTAAGICDTCEGQLVRRIDDADLATLIKRLGKYRKDSEPVVEKARKYFKVISVPSSCALEENFRLYESLLEDPQNSQDSQENLKALPLPKSQDHGFLDRFLHRRDPIVLDFNIRFSIA